MTVAARRFLQQLSTSPRHDREDAIVAARALWVEWPLCEVRFASPDHSLVIRVTQDVFALGSEEAPIRAPLSGTNAQRVADATGMLLITPAVSSAIWHAATVRIQPSFMTPDMSVGQLLRHNDAIEAARRGRGGLIAGHKKDVVICGRLAGEPSRVFIYGWHTSQPIALGEPPRVRKLGPGDAIQPLYSGHEAAYSDYSHGIRMMAPDAILDGSPVLVEDVLASPDLAVLLSGDGPLSVIRYAT